MIFCCHHTETESERKIRQYELAKKVIEKLRRDGKLDDICNENVLQIELYKNVLVHVHPDGSLTYGYARRIRKRK